MKTINNIFGIINLSSTLWAQFPRLLIRSIFQILTLITLVITIISCAEQLPGHHKLDINNQHSQLQNRVQAAIPSAEAFTQTVYPIFMQNCISCHGTDGNIAPTIAHNDPLQAHLETLSNQKVNLSNPANSRVVVKLLSEFHFCWDICENDAAILQAAITEWSSLIDTGTGNTEPLPNALVSSSMSIADANPNVGPQRVTDNLIAFYEFKEGVGNVAHDTSGVAPALDLIISEGTWVGGQGLKFTNGIAQATPEASRKLFNEIARTPTATNEFTVEAWVIPENLTQEDARLVTYSGDTRRRDFTLQQNIYNYEFRTRGAQGTGQNGTPAAVTDPNEQIVKTNLQHVVATFDQTTGRRIFVNGNIAVFNSDPGLLSSWSNAHTFAVGNENTNNRPFSGIIKLVAVYKRALSPVEVMKNFEAGVGEKFLLNFDVSQVLESPSTFVQIEVSELDANSYLFSTPTVLSHSVRSFRIKNLQVAVNGNIPVSGQSWRNIDTFTFGNGQILSPVSSIIAKDVGMDGDQFTLTFEAIGNKEIPAPIVTPQATVPVDGIDTAPRTGIRTFEQIMFTMASITGVDVNTDNVQNVYQELKQQLPSQSNIVGFLSSHQVGISKLALEYCDTMVDSNTLRNNFFGTTSFDFNAPANTAFLDQLKVTDLIKILTDKTMGIDLLNQPNVNDIQTAMLDLINGLTADCNTGAICDINRTQTVVKASCAAMLGSAAVTMQ